MSEDSAADATPGAAAGERGTTDRGVGDRLRSLRAVAQRAFDTVVRTRAYLALALVYGLAVVALPLAGGVGGYLPLVLDLRLAVELLVPVLAFGFGTWSVLADAHSGELDVIRTYPVTRGAYVGGAYLGRAVGLLVAVLAPIALLWVATPFVRDPQTTFLATHGTVDSPVYVGRFLALAAAYALVVLALAMAVSALARSRRSGLALAVVTVLLVVVGFDLLVVAGVARGSIDPGTLEFALAASPPGAFRGLVLETAAGGLYETAPRAGNPVASAVGLAAWALGALGVAVHSVWSPEGD